MARSTGSGLVASLRMLVIVSAPLPPCGGCVVSWFVVVSWSRLLLGSSGAEVEVTDFTTPSNSSRLGAMSSINSLISCCKASRIISPTLSPNSHLISLFDLALQLVAVEMIIDVETDF